MFVASCTACTHLGPSFFLHSARLALCGSVTCAAFKEKLSTSGGSWSTTEDYVLAALSSVADINCPWCCRLLACSCLSSESCSVTCIFSFLRRFSYWYHLSARYLSLPALVYILVSGSLPDISHFQRWSTYWYQDLCQISLTSSIGLYIGIRIFARYLSLPALVYILVSGSLPDISHFKRWSIYWYHLCARYLSLPSLVI